MSWVSDLILNAASLCGTLHGNGCAKKHAIVTRLAQIRDPLLGSHCRWW